MTTSRGIRLPPAAQDRMEAAATSKVWSSTMAVGADAALRSVGLTPAGVVTASVPSWPFPYRYPPGLARRLPPSGRINYRYPESGPRGSYGVLPDDPGTARRLGGYVRDYSRDPAGTLIFGGWSWQKMVDEYRARALFDVAMGHLKTQAQALGAHGIIAVTPAWVPRPQLSFADIEVEELRITGTTVVIPGSPPPSRLFTTTADGAEVAQLLRAGTAPSEVVFGVGIIAVELARSASRQLRSPGIGEVEQFSEALEKSLHLAFADLERRAAAFGDRVVGATHEAEFKRIVGMGARTRTRVVGTAVRRFAAHDHAPAISIMSLG